MILKQFSVLLFPVVINAATTSGQKTADFQLEVILPVCIIAAIIILGLLLCYCFCNRSDYERIEEVISTRLSIHENVVESRDIKMPPNFNEDPSDFMTPKPEIHNKDFPKGLKNVGNECYMNSIIQALASSDIVIQQFNDVKDLIPQSNRLKHFLELMDGVNSVNPLATISSNTKVLKSLIREIRWRKLSQQDSYDFLCALVNAIHTDLKQVHEEVKYPLKFELLHKFSGFNNVDKTQFHLGLAIGLDGNYQEYPGVTLEYLITNFLSPKNIDEDASKTTQTVFYKTFPEILILHIQANKWDPKTEEMIKPQYHIQYGPNLYLDLPIVKLESSQIVLENVEYKLSAVVVHMGSYKQGHYITYRRFKGSWFLLNDDQVEKVSFDCSFCPYILIYEINGDS